MSDTITNRSLSDEARLFYIPISITLPEELSTLELCSVAPFEFEIVDIRQRVGVGNMTVTFDIDGVPIETDIGDSVGAIDINSPALATATPDGSNTLNNVVEIGSKLSITFNHVSSDTDGYVCHINCRRTQENVP